MLGKHLITDHGESAVERVDDGARLQVDSTIRLGDQRRLQHVVDDLCLIGLIAKLLQDGHRRAAVRNPEKQYAHGSITTRPR